jgi:hypothetical protein
LPGPVAVGPDEVHVLDYHERGRELPGGIEDVGQPAHRVRGDEELGVPVERSHQVAHEQGLSRAGRAIQEHPLAAGHAETEERLAAPRELERVSLDQFEHAGREDDVFARRRRKPREAQGRRTFVEGVLRLRGSEHLAAPGLRTFGGLPQARKHRFGERAVGPGHRELDQYAGAAKSLAHVEQGRNADLPLAREPKSTLQAAQRLVFANLDLVVDRGSDSDPRRPFLDQVGEAKRKPRAAQPRAEEAQPRRLRQFALQALLDVRAHPVREARPKHRQPVELVRAEVIRQHLSDESRFAHSHFERRKRKAGRSRSNPEPSTGGRATCNQHRTAAASNHSSVPRPSITVL